MPVDFDARVLEKIDKIEDKLDTTCDNVSEIKTEVALFKQKLNTHLANIEKKEDDKNKRFYYLIALISVIFGSVEIYQILV